MSVCLCLLEQNMSKSTVPNNLVLGESFRVTKGRDDSIFKTNSTEVRVELRGPKIGGRIRNRKGETF